MVLVCIVSVIHEVVLLNNPNIFGGLSRSWRWQWSICCTREFGKKNISVVGRLLSLGDSGIITISCYCITFLFMRVSFDFLSTAWGGWADGGITKTVYTAHVFAIKMRVTLFGVWRCYRLSPLLGTGYAQRQTHTHTLEWLTNVFRRAVLRWWDDVIGLQIVHDYPGLLRKAWHVSSTRAPPPRQSKILIFICWRSGISFEYCHHS